MQCTLHPRPETPSLAGACWPGFAFCLLVWQDLGLAVLLTLIPIDELRVINQHQRTAACRCRCCFCTHTEKHAGQKGGKNRAWADKVEKRSAEVGRELGPRPRNVGAERTGSGSMEEGKSRAHLSQEGRLRQQSVNVTVEWPAASLGVSRRVRRAPGLNTRHTPQPTLQSRCSINVKLTALTRSRAPRGTDIYDPFISARYDTFDRSSPLLRFSQHVSELHI